MINLHKVYIIAAVDAKGGIGKGGSLPWRLKKEMRHFTEITTRTSDPSKENMVVMGRTTWESIPEKFRPLPGRRNVVLSRDPNYQAPGARVYHALRWAIESATDDVEKIFIIGGQKIYSNALNDDWVKSILDGIYLTRLKKDFNCDTFFPSLPNFFGAPLISGHDEEDGVKFDFLFYQNTRY